MFVSSSLFPDLVVLLCFWTMPPVVVVWPVTVALLSQELLSLAKRKRTDSDEQDEPVSKPAAAAASTDSETSDSDDEVGPCAVVQSDVVI